MAVDARRDVRRRAVLAREGRVRERILSGLVAELVGQSRFQCFFNCSRGARSSRYSIERRQQQKERSCTQWVSHVWAISQPATPRCFCNPGTTKRTVHMKSSEEQAEGLSPYPHDNRSTSGTGSWCCHTISRKRSPSGLRTKAKITRSRNTWGLSGSVFEFAFLVPRRSCERMRWSRLGECR